MTWEAHRAFIALAGCLASLLVPAQLSRGNTRQGIVPAATAQELVAEQAESSERLGDIGFVRIEVFDHFLRLVRGRFFTRSRSPLATSPTTI